METVSEGQISEPTTAQYRTVPLRPYNVTFDPLSIGLVEQIIICHLQITRDFCELIITCVSWLFQTGPDYFSVRWRGPTDVSEFDRYQVFGSHVMMFELH